MMEKREKSSKKWILILFLIFFIWTLLQFISPMALPENSVKDLSGLTGVSDNKEIIDKMPAPWNSVYGCILSIDDSEATIGYLQLGSLYAADTNQFIDRYALQTFPVELDLTISGSDYSKVTVSETETTSDINTGVTLKDAVGNDVTPAVGDLVVRANRTTGNGDATVHYSLWYYLE